MPDVGSHVVHVSANGILSYALLVNVGYVVKIHASPPS